jgi:hypothetical protein
VVVERDVTGPVIEVATGAVDGINNLFQTTNPFFPGSVQVFINGLITKADNADGWAEVPPSVVILSEAPRAGDVVQVYYLSVS